mmetsp:Transcript_11321/g.12640  ORF Transcript_11321/g.12640 Transcript_11321/m.12640 type:complete len:88 (-) Transcript_11321:762-1025(-)
MPCFAASSDPSGGEWRNTPVHSKYISSRGKYFKMKPGKNKSRPATRTVIPVIVNTVRPKIRLTTDEGVLPSGIATAGLLLLILILKM